MKKALLLCGMLLLQPLAATATETSYPEKSVRMMVGFPTGSGTDIQGRRIAHELSQSMGESFFIENKPGVGGGLVVDNLIRSRPDGYTLLVSSTGPLTLAPAVNPNLTYDPQKDLEPIATLTRGGLLLLVNQNSPYKTLEDLVEAAKAKPGDLTYASSGAGVTNHVLMEMFMHRAGLDMMHVPYKGATPALVDLAAGRVDAMFEAPAAAEALITQGMIRPIAISGSNRDSSLPDVPTVAEKGYPGFRAETWVAVLGPKGIPDEILEKLNQEINKIVKTEQWKVESQRVGTEPLIMSRAELADYIKEEVETWGEAAKRAAQTAY